MCQENHPELYDFICEAILYHSNGNKETILKRESVYPGRCIIDESGYEPIPAVTGRFVKLKDEPDTAEVAFTVVDSYQRKGVQQVSSLSNINHLLSVSRFSQESDQ